MLDGNLIVQEPGFDDLDKVHTSNLLLPGWKPISVRYGIYHPISGNTLLIWNVIGTDHAFTIPLKEVTERHHEDYNAHFKATLERFRQDYLEWYSGGWQENWMKRYWDFGKLIYK